MNLKFENIRSIEAELSGRLLRRGYSTLCSHFVDFLGTIHVTLRVCRRHPSALHILQSSYNGCYTKPIIPFKTTFNFNLRFWLLLYNKYATCGCLQYHIQNQLTRLPIKALWKHATTRIC